MRKVLRGLVLFVGVVGCVIFTAPTHAMGQAQGKLPVLGKATPVKEFSGRVTESSQGQSSPVRVILELEDGRELRVLIAPDAVCERLGLLFKTGDELTVIGYELQGDSPLLVARAVVVDGRRVELVEDQGPGKPTASGAGVEDGAAAPSQVAD